MPLLVLVVQPAFAAKDDRTAVFRMVGTEFTMRLPEGYCLPEGKANDVAQLLAAADNVNVTHLTAVRCHSVADPAALTDYILLKSPKVALTTIIGREMLVKTMGVEFDKPEFLSALNLDKMNGEVSTALSNVFNQKVNIDGQIQPLGKDAACAFLGGTISIKGLQGEYKSSMGGCITSVSDRVLVLYWYGPDKGAAGVADLIVKVRGLVERIEGKPAN